MRCKDELGSKTMGKVMACVGGDMLRASLGLGCAGENVGPTGLVHAIDAAADRLGFGIAGYELALRGLKQIVGA